MCIRDRYIGAGFDIFARRNHQTFDSIEVLRTRRAISEAMDAVYAIAYDAFIPVADN